MTLRVPGAEATIFAVFSVFLAGTVVGKAQEERLGTGLPDSERTVAS